MLISNLLAQKMSLKNAKSYKSFGGFSVFALFPGFFADNFFLSLF